MRITPENGLDVLNDYLDKGWLVFSTTAFIPFISNSTVNGVTTGATLIVLQKYESD